jgi:hypothetical protein
MMMLEHVRRRMQISIFSTFISITIHSHRFPAR